MFPRGKIRRQVRVSEKDRLRLVQSIAAGDQARSRAIDRLRFEHRNKRFNNYVDRLLTTTAANDPREGKMAPNFS
jgi:hypothetical protein